ncbi:MAG: DUF167 domain-containing protein [Holosporales bacterium]|nr:DUF167 domain-containing protein [Holosporales bacterium]
MILSVKLTPKASKNAIVGFKANVLQIKVTVAPEKNEANKAAIELISDFLGIPKSKILIISGAKFRNKVISIDTDNTESLINKIQNGFLDKTKLIRDL